jgi:hypothetical protein
MDYEIARYIVKKMEVSVDSSRKVSVSLLSRHMVKRFGDRDVVKRSLRAFLTTLVYFDILARDKRHQFFLQEKQTLSLERARKFIVLYSKAFIRSKIINLKEIAPEFLYFFKPVDLSAVGIEYNGRYWEYIREIEREMIILK